MTARDAHPGFCFVRVDRVLGRADEGDWPGRLEGARVDPLRLDHAEAHKSRLRKATDGGTVVAISLDRGAQLSDGDILVWEEARRTAVVARVDLPDVLVIDLSAVLDGPPELSMATCVELGHALGNQHWPAVVTGTCVYVPLTVGHAVMTSVLKTHSFRHVSFAFAPGAEVAARLAPGAARRLFGTGGGHQHLSDRDTPTGRGGALA